MILYNCIYDLLVIVVIVVLSAHNFEDVVTILICSCNKAFVKDSVTMRGCMYYMNNHQLTFCMTKARIR